MRRFGGFLVLRKRTGKSMVTIWLGGVLGGILAFSTVFLVSVMLLWRRTGVVSGLTDWGLAGTNPTNAASVLRLDEAASVPPDTLQLGWSSVSGALYRVEGRDALTGAVPWSAVSATVTATPPLNVHTTTVHGTQGFYRIRLEAVP